ncbi:hypothetical protein ARMSODRAFT_1002971 [Armillaria solidipes]|uniref:Uncharacterized protein n=1 Tax=Armillaria solidipes TaxID=1076256 RepID=A0A2H3BYH6_9AGAR|nr:hypothetical protein ARMSODRAFT_1002971 [Armillaria solidipes]
MPSGTSEGIPRAAEASQGCILLTRSPRTVFLTHPVAPKAPESDYFILHPDASRPPLTKEMTSTTFRQPIPPNQYHPHPSPSQASPPIDIGANRLRTANPHTSITTDTIQDRISGAICRTATTMTGMAGSVQGRWRGRAKGRAGLRDKEIATGMRSEEGGYEREGGVKVRPPTSNDGSDDDVRLDVDYPPMDTSNETNTMPTTPLLRASPIVDMGIMAIRPVSPPDIVTTAHDNDDPRSRSPPHPPPSIDHMTTIGPLPPFLIAGNPMVVFISPHEPAPSLNPTTNA